MDRDISGMLKKDSIESLLYIAMMVSKSQTDAIELIYDSKTINSSPVKNARNRMMEAHVLDIVDLSNMRNIPYLSKIDPFLNHLFEKSKAQSEVRKSRNPIVNTLNETDIKYLKLILDSNYYRGIFFNRFFFDHGSAIIQSTLKREGDKLTIPAGAFGYMETMLMAIVNISIELKSCREFDDDYIKYEDVSKIVKEYKSPDKFVTNFLESKNPGIFKYLSDFEPVVDAIEDSALDFNPQPYTDGSYCEGGGYEYFLDRTIFSGLFLVFPPELMSKIRLSDLESTCCSFNGYLRTAIDRYKYER
ncbi:MAG: hypothetical protein Q8J68_00485 [Methanolobus sp.]|uniref:hypothetical protein n=1 Tax=Methanolobus sp. TaxID=1874737 RepID=UPI0027321ECA|nr:hypothetical protein [Methanolobus sp.]MDP2215759.1 hypothetical protein [Methanolobus sp.]